MLGSDGVQIFASGAVSAANFAGLATVSRSQIPMVIGSILPPPPDDVKWAFSVIHNPEFEIQTRYAYLRDKTKIRKIAILSDPSPYALRMRDYGTKVASDYGLEVVNVQAYRSDNADDSVQINAMNAAGAEAIIKNGNGGSTLTVARNIKQLGLDKMLLVSSIDSAAVFKDAAEILGERFLFVAQIVQLPEAATDPDIRKATMDFLRIWQAKFGDEDPGFAPRAWDAMMIINRAVTNAKSFEGPAVRDAVERLTGYHGAAGTYNFSPSQHGGMAENQFFMGVVRDGRLAVAP
jgi:ABC-type branched-subunit amino acid transport system substrate-binding protein